MSLLTIEARLEMLDSALDFVATEAEKAYSDAINVNRIRLVAEEVLVNIISYAYPGTTGTIEISCTGVPEKGLSLEIADYGIPFDPLLNAPANFTHLPIEERPIGGLGLSLVTSVMDSVIYERAGDRNILSMEKRGKQGLSC